MIREFDEVALTVDLPQYRLKEGDVGTVVDISPNGKQYTLEFFNFDGETITVVPVDPLQVRRISNKEITHTRVMES